jgi:hypothetical protein
MIDPLNREWVNQSWLVKHYTQVIILLGFTETTPGKYPNRIEIYYRKLQISALLLKDLQVFLAFSLTAML